MKRGLIILIISLILISGCGEPEEQYFTPNTTNINNNTNTTNNNTDNQTNTTEDHVTCLDTDEGIDYSEKGTTVVSNGKYRQVQDRCENSRLLIEYYCKEDNTLGMELYECLLDGDVCINGTCGDAPVINETNSTNST